MKRLIGITLGLFAGAIYLLFAFAAGWEGGLNANTVAFFTGGFATAMTAVIALTIWFSPSPIWIHPLMVALPTVIVGLIALAEKPPVVTVIGIGIATFIFGLIASYLMIRPRRKPTRPSNSQFDTDEQARRST